MGSGPGPGPDPARRGCFAPAIPVIQAAAAAAGPIVFGVILIAGAIAIGVYLYNQNKNNQTDQDSESAEDADLSGLPDSVPKPLGRGHIGRTEPQNLKEQEAMTEVRSNPDGDKIPVEMTDPRWPSSDGWIKKSENVNGVEVHYVENTTTGQVDDFKFKDR